MEGISKIARFQIQGGKWVIEIFIHSSVCSKRKHGWQNWDGWEGFVVLFIASGTSRESKLHFFLSNCYFNGINYNNSGIWVIKTRRDRTLFAKFAAYDYRLTQEQSCFGLIISVVFSFIRWTAHGSCLGQVGLVFACPAEKCYSKMICFFPILGSIYPDCSVWGSHVRPEQRSHRGRSPRRASVLRAYGARGLCVREK